MSNDYFLIDFLDKSRSCKSVVELSELTQKTFEKMGFPMWAYQTKSESILGKSEPIFIHNFPEKWEDYYISNKCTQIDPVITYGSKIVSPFQWSVITQGRKLSADEMDYQKIASEHGMNDGLAVPIIGGNGRISMLSLATDCKSMELSKSLAQYYNQILAITFAFHSIAKDLIKDDDIVSKKVFLSEREKECILWVAKGKTSWEIGKILSISERTVRFHINNSMQKLGVHNRYQLVIQALLESDIYL